jgi:transglutaminase/protease-like cytokinesis protein 3
MTIQRKSVQGKRKKKQNRRQSWAEGSVLFLLGFTFFSFWYLSGNNPLKIDIRTLTRPYILGQPSDDFPPENSGQSINIGASQTLEKLDFSEIDRSAATISYQGSSVDELAGILATYTQTEAEKARIIYAWITNHIAYDAEAFFNNQLKFLSPEEILTRRKGVCSAYAILFRALAKAMGLDAVAITGYAKGYGYLVGDDTRENHAWNAVKIDASWYLIDATWGAGTIENTQFTKRFNSYYFAPPPDQFIYDHFPSQEKWQLLNQPYNRQTFNNLPDVSSNFFTDNIRLVNYPTNTIHADGQVNIILDIPDDVVIVSQLKQNGIPLAGTYTFEQKTNGQFVVSVGFPEAGEYELEIYSARENNSGIYRRALTYNIITAKSSSQFPETYRNFHLNSVYLYSPVTKSLPPNQYIYFQVNVPNATDVAVIQDGSGSHNWTKLEQNGMIFKGAVQVGTGKIKLSAKFAGDDRYWGLVEYN